MSETRERPRRGPRGRAHAVAASILLALFVFRVGAQLWQSFAPTSLLPPFQAWHSGALAYPALVAAQIAIIVFVVWLVQGFWRGAIPPSAAVGRWSTWIGLAYLVGAVLRLGLGLTVARDVPFLGDLLPAFFHIVLASIVLVAADYFRAGAGR